MRLFFILIIIGKVLYFHLNKCMVTLASGPVAEGTPFLSKKTMNTGINLIALSEKCHGLFHVPTGLTAFNFACKMYSSKRICTCISYIYLHFLCCC